MRTLFLPLLICSIIFNHSVSSYGQKVASSVSVQEAAPGEVFEWTISIDGAKGSLDKIQSIAPFKIISGPSSYLNMQYSFGQKIVQQQWTYHVMAPETPGKHTIPSITVKSGRKKFKTDPHIIQVLTQSPKKENLGSGNITEEIASTLLLTINKKKAHVGEQLILDAYVLSRQDILSLELAKGPFSPDIFIKEMNIPSQTAQSIKIGGKTYLKQLIYRAAIYPQRAGQLTISPMRLKAIVRGELAEDDPFSWLNNNVKAEELVSENIVLEVIDPFLIQTVPVIKGCGDFVLQNQSFPEKVATGQKFSLLVKLTGYGDPNRISKPEPIHEHQIQYYPEPDIQAEFNEDALGIKNTISWQYTFVAVDTGKIAIRLPFYFFNSTIDNIDSIIITDTIYAITSATSLANEISSSPENTDKTYSNSRNIWIYVGISLLGFLILSAGIYIVWFIVKQHKKNIRLRNKGNSSSGLQINRIHLQLLEKYVFENNPDQFYKLLRDDMQGVLESLKLENKDNTVEINLEQILSRLNFQEDEIHDWMQINQLASQYLYGLINHAYPDNSQLNEILTRYLVLRHKLSR